MEMQDVLKKDVWKLNIVHWLKLNNYSKCLMCASTALQTSLKHTSLRKCINTSPFSVWALISRSSMQELMISPILSDET